MANFFRVVAERFAGVLVTCHGAKRVRKVITYRRRKLFCSHSRTIRTCRRPSTRSWKNHSPSVIIPSKIHLLTISCHYRIFWKYEKRPMTFELTVAGKNHCTLFLFVIIKNILVSTERNSCFALQRQFAKNPLGSPRAVQIDIILQTAFLIFLPTALGQYLEPVLTYWSPTIATSTWRVTVIFRIVTTASMPRVASWWVIITFRLSITKFLRSVISFQSRVIESREYTQILSFFVNKTEGKSDYRTSRAHINFLPAK